MFNLSLMRYEIDDFISSTDDKVLINGYRNYVIRYHNKLPLFYDWLKTLSELQLDILRLVYRSRTIHRYESIRINANYDISNNDDILIFFNEELYLYLTLTMIERPEY